MTHNDSKLMNSLSMIFEKKLILSTYAINSNKKKRRNDLHCQINFSENNMLYQVINE